MKFLASLISSILLAALPLAAADYDLVIRNGRVIDGIGTAAFRADVAIKDGRIVAVSRTLPGRGAEEIDARGLHVAPGFIDVHAHTDRLQQRPEAENFVRMGVTTLVTGNCGSSQVDVGAYFEVLNDTPISVNLATLIGHNAIRRVVVGRAEDRDPTPRELEQMKELVDKAMREGAVGLSTGLIYIPGTYSKTPEIVELAKVAALHGGIYASHMRNEGTGVMDALEELFTIAREADIPAQVSHIKVAARAVFGLSTEVLDAIEARRAEGLDITQDMYLYPASATSLNTQIPAEFREGGRSALQRRLADPTQRAQIKEAMQERLRERGEPDYGFVAINSFRGDRSLQGLRVPEAAERRFGNRSLESQMELILEIAAAGGASAVFHSMNEDDLQNFLRHPNTMIAADAGVRRLGSGMPHPRGSGNSARVLARYVRELQVLRLEDAVRRMTSLPATTFQLAGRGQIAPGFAADIVVFDPAAVQDNATFEDPHHFATGFHRVLVNGKVVVADDTLTDARPGRPLRRGEQ